MVKRDFGTIILFFFAGLATHRTILELKRRKLFGFSEE